MGSPTVVHGSRQKERERERGVIALGATVEFNRSRTAHVPRQGYRTRAHPRASERASQRVFALLMLTNEGYIIIGETAERIPFIDLSRNMQEPFYGFVSLVSEQVRIQNRARSRFAAYHFEITFKARISSISSLSLLVNQNQRSIFDTCTEFERS